MEIIAAIIIFVVGVLVEAAIGIRWSMCGAGTLLGIAIMGAFILWAVWHPKEKQI